MLFTDAFRAMDTDIDIEIAAPTRPHAAFISIRLLFERQEQCFSRFRESSLLSVLNSGGTVTDPTFAAACRLALEAFACTGGLFNPMILPALRQAGYNRTFADARSGGGSLRAATIPDPTRCLRMEGDRISLHDGQLDLGGIVKGWTADLAAAMFADEFTGLLVNAGGDIRTTGDGDDDGAWVLAIERPGGGPPLWEGAVAGGCATSTTLRRKWNTTDGAPAHHLIDPRTGLPSQSPFVQATAWAPETWRAEAWAKAILIGGSAAAASARANGYQILTVDAQGAISR